jgi:hypothetical protein
LQGRNHSKLQERKKMPTFEKDMPPIHIVPLKDFAKGKLRGYVFISSDNEAINCWYKHEYD